MRKSHRRGKKLYNDVEPLNKTASAPELDNSIEDELKWKMTESFGGKFNNCPAIFSPTSTYKSLNNLINSEFFVAVGSAIKVFNTSTGLMLRKMTMAHSDTIISIKLNPTNSSQVFSASLNGVVCIWNHEECKLEKSWDLNVQITAMACPPNNYSKSIYLLTKSANGENSQLQKLETKNGKLKAIKTWKYFVCALDISKDGKYIVAGGEKKFHVFEIKDNGSKHHRMSYKTNERINALAIHPTDPCVAIGDMNGRITLWYCLGIQDKKSVVCSSLHWHAHQVNALQFTNDGVYLLSGGQEGVLVLWQLETRSRQFLPHLGSDVYSITTSHDQLMYLIGLKDNSLNVVSAVNLSIKKSISGLKLANANKKMYPLSTGIQIDPKNKSLVLNGYPGTVQFYNYKTESHIRELEITPRNRVIRTDEKDLNWPHVKHIAFSQNGDWMATVDERVDPLFDSERYLLFWKYDNDKQIYVAHTRMDSPHQGQITGLKMTLSGGKLLAATYSLDKTFKIWELIKGQSQFDDSWNCRSTGFYKDSKIVSADFSSDGSLLAVAFGTIITLWDPWTNTLEKTLAYSPFSNEISHISFTKDSLYLIASSKNYLHVWNMLTCTVWWSMEIQTRLIETDSNSNNFIAIAERNSVETVILFDATNPIPLFSKAIENEGDTVLACTFVKAESPEILFLLKNYQFKILSTNTVSLPEPSMVSSKTEKSLLFSNMFGPRKLIESSAVVSSVVASRTDKVASFLEVPTYMAPPPLLFVNTFLSSLLDIKKVVVETEVAVEEKITKETLSMDVDSILEEYQVPDMNFMTEIFST